MAESKNGSGIRNPWVGVVTTLVTTLGAIALAWIGFNQQQVQLQQQLDDLEKQRVAVEVLRDKARGSEEETVGGIVSTQSEIRRVYAKYRIDKEKWLRHADDQDMVIAELTVGFEQMKTKVRRLERKHLHRSNDYDVEIGVIEPMAAKEDPDLIDRGDEIKFKFKSPKKILKE